MAERRCLSQAFYELQNLDALARHHKATCRDQECGVSINVIRMTALRLMTHVDDAERAEAKEMVDKWPM